MNINIIAAIDENNAIGKNGTIPWNQKADLKRFQTLTDGDAVIIGRSTWWSLPKPTLLNRKLIVVTNTPIFINSKELWGVRFESSLESAIDYAKNNGFRTAWIAGGERIYSEGMNVASKLYITKIFTKVDNPSKFFPNINNSVWSETEGSVVYASDDYNDHDYRYIIYTKNT